MAQAVILSLCRLLAVQCTWIDGDVLNIGVSTTVVPGQGAASSVGDTRTSTLPTGRFAPPVTDGSVESILSLPAALPFTLPGDGDESDEGGVDDWGVGEGEAAVVRTSYPLPFPVFKEGKYDVGTGTLLTWAYRNGACVYQPEPYSGPQFVALGWWHVNPRHPERGSLVAMCDGDRGQNLVPVGLYGRSGGDGGVIVSCPGRMTHGRTYDDSCTVFPFTNDRCVSASIANGNVFSYVFRCQGTGN